MITALMSFNGFGQEDSFIMNKSVIERGQLRSQFLKGYANNIKKENDVFVESNDLSSNTTKSNSNHSLVIMDTETMLNEYKKRVIEDLIYTHSLFKTTEGNNDEHFNNLLKLIEDFKFVEQDIKIEDDVISITI